MCHGIPDSRKLRDGDIINIDVTVYLQASPTDALLSTVVPVWCLHMTQTNPRDGLRNACVQGFHGDTSAMFYVGEVSSEARRLCEITKACMEAGIAQCRPGALVRNIGKVGFQSRPCPVGSLAGGSG